MSKSVTLGDGSQLFRSIRVTSIEWAEVVGTAPVPPPAALAILAVAPGGPGLMRRGRRG